MNYRHIFHAGNFADVMKHALLCRVLLYLGAKDAPFRVIDTHAGIGRYDLTSETAQRSPEWRDGIGRLLGVRLPDDVTALLKPYLDIVAPLMAGPRALYPGSPEIALKLTRTQDRLSFIEKHPIDVNALKSVVAGDRRAKALCLDGWTAWNAQVPPPERRGVVLVDPPFEEPGEWQRLCDGLRASHRKWPGGTVMLWYPIKDPLLIEEFIEALGETGIPKMLRLELVVDRVDRQGPLSGTGMIVVNPPFTLEAEARILLAFLAKRLSRGPAASTRIEWIAGE